MTRVAILQSNYIPWRGYFDLMDDVDVFIVYDEVQYTKNDWRNRNKLKTRSGSTWISIPVWRDGLQTRIDEARINYTTDWIGAHRQLLIENYRGGQYFDEISAPFFAEIEKKHELLSALNVSLLRQIAERLEISTRLLNSRELHADGNRTEKLIALVNSVGGNTYLSGPAAEAYLDVAAFKRAGIALEYKSYDYEPYPQLWGPFDGAVSVLDLLMNVGPDARRYLKSRTPNRRVVG